MAGARRVARTTGRVRAHCARRRLRLRDRDERRAFEHLPSAGPCRRRCGGHITRECSGPSRRVSFLWFETRRGAGSATDRPYVMQRNELSAEPRITAEVTFLRTEEGG